MEVLTLEPQGFCKGVIYALNLCLKTLENNALPRPIYLLGNVIHNEQVCDVLEKTGIVTIPQTNNRMEMLDFIDQGTVIISAHGVQKSVFDKAKQKGLTVVDATCPDVKKVHQQVLKHLKEKDIVLYIGSPNHPETLGVLGENEAIVLIDNLKKISTLDNEKSYYVTNQTTLSQNDLEPFYTAISNHLSKVQIENKICQATTARQNALWNQKADLIVIVGDRHSSNAKKLYEVAHQKAKAKKIVQIETYHDLQNLDLSGYHKALVTSSASTPYITTKQVIDYLKNYPKTPTDEKLSIDNLLIRKFVSKK